MTQKKKPNPNSTIFFQANMQTTSPLTPLMADPAEVSILFLTITLSDEAEQQ